MTKVYRVYELCVENEKGISAIYAVVQAGRRL
jgi:hypothetical protein